jgi:hypothetical protein
MKTSELLRTWHWRLILVLSWIIGGAITLGILWIVFMIGVGALSRDEGVVAILFLIAIPWLLIATHRAVLYVRYGKLERDSSLQFTWLPAFMPIAIFLILVVVGLFFQSTKAINSREFVSAKFDGIHAPKEQMDVIEVEGVAFSIKKNGIARLTASISIIGATTNSQKQSLGFLAIAEGQPKLRVFYSPDGATNSWEEFTFHSMQLTPDNVIKANFNSLAGKGSAEFAVLDSGDWLLHIRSKKTLAYGNYNGQENEDVFAYLPFFYLRQLASTNQKWQVIWKARTQAPR